MRNFSTLLFFQTPVFWAVLRSKLRHRSHLGFDLVNRLLDCDMIFEAVDQLLGPRSACRQTIYHYSKLVADEGCSFFTSTPGQIPEMNVKINPGLPCQRRQ